MWRWPRHSKSSPTRPSTTRFSPREIRSASRRGGRERIMWGAAWHRARVGVGTNNNNNK
jgi:hypothetical protein